MATRTARTTRRGRTARPRPSSRQKLLKDGSVPERIIQRQILNWLKNSGYLHWRQNSGKIPVSFRGRRINLGDPGLPDIIVIVPPSGRVVGLEVKSAYGRLRPVQKAFRERLEAVGGHYSVVRTLGEAMHALANVEGEVVWKEG